MPGYCDSAPGHPLHGPYHDGEYGFPSADEAVLFERAVRHHAASGRALRLGPETSRYRAHQRTAGTALRHIGRRLGEALTGSSSTPDSHGT